MKLERLDVSQLRVINHVSIQPGSQFNLIVGPNGSGKTSLLESIYLLAFGRSFRTHLGKRLITDSMDFLSVYAELDNQVALGLMKTKDGRTKIKVSNNIVSSIAELATHLPLHVITPDSYKLLDGGPKFRRQFLDWGVFHVKHSFIESWRRYQQALRQRNHALRQQQPFNLVQIWDEELVECANYVSQCRQEYFDIFVSVFDEILQKLGGKAVSISLYPGWNRKKTYTEALKNAIKQDYSLGYSQFGPHRADLRIMCGSMPAVDILSRGQQKIVVIALCLAQAQVHSLLLKKSGVFLVDDLAAELDQKRRECVVDFLSQLHSQVFITAINPLQLPELKNLSDTKIFEILDGQLVAIDKHNKKPFLSTS